MTTKLRLSVGGTALAAGLLLLSGATTAAPTLPKEAYKKAAEADIAALKAHLKMLETNAPDPNTKGAHRTARALSIMIAYYAEATGDQALRDQSLKVAEELEKIKKAAHTPTTKRAMGKENAEIAAGAKAAAALADKLAVKPGAAPLKATALHEAHKIDLEEIMGPFRRGEDKENMKHYGGLNMEKDIKDAIKNPPVQKIDPAAVELIAIRTATIGELSIHLPNNKAMVNAANKAEWAKWTKDMTDLSQKLSTEAAKGKAADGPAMVKFLNAIDTKCKECHNKYRDD